MRGIRKKKKKWGSPKFINVEVKVNDDGLVMVESGGGSGG